ncbi:MAG: c-type cytochrome [Chromatiaceae bacterium]|jgi:cytochrome c5|nr:c-type cytochrome [Chromatiaceae bacterium]
MLNRARGFGLAALLLVTQLYALPGRADWPGYDSDTRAYNLAHGRVVFTENCMRCHESGRKGAPVFGDTGDWAERLEQPLDTLVDHAIAGHGRMPARGDLDLSDQDVASAVAYVVDRTRVIAAEEGKPQPARAAGASTGQAGEVPDHAVMQMFLLLVGKDRWK